VGEGEGSNQMSELQAKWIKLKPGARLYSCDFPIVALTGGIASGKSTVAKFLKEQGVAVISADELIKDIYRWPLTKIWLTALAPDVLENGEVLFAKLREKVFQDAALKVEVENFLYARLPQAFQDRLKSLGNVSWLVYEIPLLFERQMQDLFDVVVVSWVPVEIQKQRLLSRDPLTTASTADAILGAQLSLDEKKKKADLVFDNTRPPGPEMDQALKDLWTALVR
jgi:dephospho-CoA kinase